MPIRIFIYLMVSSAALFSVPLATQAAKRVALVIGNSAYEHVAVLDNPVNDATSISNALAAHGFEVIKGLDLNHNKMRTTIRKFSRALRSADVGVFFYAGHGIQVSGKNYLVPTDARLEDRFGIDFELVQLERIHHTMERSTKLNLVFLDACRNNPLARNLARSMGTRSSSVGQGLAVMESGIGSLISFSTQPGNVALDGQGSRNSPYSASLAKHIAEGDGDITEILIKVRRDVMKATSQKQVPWEHSALTQQFFFSKPKPAPQATPSISKPMILQQADIAFWNSVKDSNDLALLDAYLQKFPTGTFASIARLLTDKLKKELEREQQVTAKQRELGQAREKERLAALARKAAEAKAQQQVERDLQAEKLQKAMNEARLARKALMVAQKERAAAIKKVEAARRLDEKAVKQAEKRRPTQLASLPSTVSADTQQEAKPKNYANDIQRRLKQLGCYTGRVDGRWGSKSRSALATALGSTRNLNPTQQNLEKLSSVNRSQCAKVVRRKLEQQKTNRKKNTITKQKSVTRRRKVGGGKKNLTRWIQCRSQCQGHGYQCRVSCDSRFGNHYPSGR